MLEDPETDAERVELARTCEASMQLGFPILVDGIDDAVGRAFAAWPDRMYVVDLDGSVVYKGGKGPMGFLPDELEGVLAELVAFYSGGEGGAPETER